MPSVAVSAAPPEPAVAAAPVDAPLAAPEVPATVEAPATEAAPETPAEVAPEVVAEPAAEAPPAVAEAEPVAPAYEAFKVPEGLTLPEERVAEYTAILGKHNLTQEAGQELIDLHASALGQMQASLAQHQQDAFADTRRTWREDFYKSAGNRSDTMANDAKWAITKLVTDAAQRKELYTVLDNTGAGDHKAVIGLLARAARVMRERDAPPPGLTPKAPERTPAQRRYDKQPAR